MNTAYFTLYGRNDKPLVTVMIEDKKDHTAFGFALCSDSDKFDSFTGMLRAIDATRKGINERAFRTPRALRLLHSLCEQDFVKVVMFLESVIGEGPAAPFWVSGKSDMTYQEAVRWFNED